MAKVQDKNIKTLHTFMMKKVVDDPDGGLRVTGTFIQSVYGLTEDQIISCCGGKEDDENKKEHEAFFDYRFDLSKGPQTEEFVHVRRSKPTEDKDNEKGKVKLGVKTTLDVCIPLEIEPFLTAFPFEVSIATAQIELVSKTCKDTKEDTTAMLRPDLYVHKTDPRQTISIKNNDTILKKFGREIEKKNNLDQIIDIVDKTAEYNLLSPYPEVYYEKHPTKDFCQKFSLSFYVVKSGFHKVFSILLPMFLVSVVALMNVLNDMARIKEDDSSAGEDATNHLQVSSALTLAIVFVLNDACNKDRLFNSDNVNTIAFFLGLVLASIPSSIGTIVPETLGVIFMFLALIRPLKNCYDYAAVQYKIRSQGKLSTENVQFLKDNKYKPDKDVGNFARVCDLLQELRKKQIAKTAEARSRAKEIFALHSKHLTVDGMKNERKSRSSVEGNRCDDRECYSADKDGITLWWKEGMQNHQNVCHTPTDFIFPSGRSALHRRHSAVDPGSMNLESIIINDAINDGEGSTTIEFQKEKVSDEAFADQA